MHLHLWFFMAQTVVCVLYRMIRLVVGPSKNWSKTKIIRVEGVMKGRHETLAKISLETLIKVHLYVHITWALFLWKTF